MQILKSQSINLHFLGVEVSHNLQKDFAIRQLSNAPHGLRHHLGFQLTR